MLGGMNLFLDSFWRALVYCVRPRVIALSFVPLLLMGGLSVAAVYYFWDPAVRSMQAWLAEWALLESLLRWLDSVGMEHLRTVVAPLLVLMLMLPAVVVLSLLAVSWLMTPALVTLVAERRFAGLQRQPGGVFWRSVMVGLGSSLLALVALLLSMPLWLIPPLVLVLPPLIWGWLNYRVMIHDTLAPYASADERRELMRRHRIWLLLIGVASGYLGAAPGMVWAIGALAIVFAPLLVPLAIWIYTFVFAFSSLWFAHFCLAALVALRAQPGNAAPDTPDRPADPDILLAPDVSHD